MAQRIPNQGGLRWVRSLNAGGAAPQPTIELVASAYATALFRGDYLAPVNDGTVAVAAAGVAGRYVFQEAVNYLEAGGTTRGGPYLPVTTYTGNADLTNPLASKILAIPVIDQIFEIDMDAAETSWATAQAKVGLGFDLVATAAGSTVTGLSGYTLDTSTGLTNAGQFILVEIPRYGTNGCLNDVTVARWKCHVRVNPAELDDGLG